MLLPAWWRIYLCLPVWISQLASDIRENVSLEACVCLFCLRQAFGFETQAHALSFLRGPSHPRGGLRHVHERQHWGVHFHPLSFGRFPNILSYPALAAHFFVSHPLSPQPHLCCLPLSIPQLWFRCHGCSHLLPALDQVTLPLLSRSPREGAPCQA